MQITDENWRLTIMLLGDIGVGEEVHEIDISLLKKTSQKLEEYQHEKVTLIN